jgi:hypothetical protein
MFHRLPLVLFALSTCIGAFLFGVSVGFYEHFPFMYLRDARVTLNAIAFVLDHDEYPGNEEFLKFSNISIASVNTSRVRSLSNEPDNDQTFLMFGGLHHHLELCPKNGCLAVEIESDGNVVHAYPYFPESIYAANSTGEDYPHEFLQFDPRTDMRPIGIERFPNGDLLVIFQRSLSTHVFPFGTGVARVDRQGQPRWFRFDYSHHWPSPIRGDNLLIPTTRIGEGSISFDLPDGTSNTSTCESGRPYHDAIQVLNGNGELIREYSVMEALLDSPYRTVLQLTTDNCDALHLNFVDVVREDVPEEIDGIEPGDLIVSLRNVSAFGILDPDDGRLKRLVRGTFIEQHSVQHLSGSRFLIFDNYGADRGGGPSRLLEVDIASGAERTIFPTPDHASHQRELFSSWAGHLSISLDRRRVIVTFSNEGIALEIRCADGKVLREFHNVHDVSSVETLAADREERAAMFRLYGINYVVP